MSSTRRAVIDIGTNSVKLLVADVASGTVQPVLEDSEQTRLGAGFFESNCLQRAAIEHTAQAVKSFADQAREQGAISTRVIATSAARDAINPGELTEAIELASGLRVEIISGEQEADWAFQGVQTDPQLAGQPLLLLDVGGGSTEFILGESGRTEFRRSYQLGTVRLMEKLPPGDPSDARQLAAARQHVNDFFKREVYPELEPALERRAKPGSPPAQLIGTGGTATILARMAAKLTSYDRALIEAQTLGAAKVREQVEQLWGLPLAERRNIVGLPKSRADIILTGVVIYEGVLNNFGFSELRVSTRGLRFAAVME
jgi:exopolyphosphatase/guanosine-5'-triphosphate,3'-diphosphate pyrophosphatase